MWALSKVTPKEDQALLVIIRVMHLAMVSFFSDKQRQKNVAQCAGLSPVATNEMLLVLLGQWVSFKMRGFLFL